MRFMWELSHRKEGGGRARSAQPTTDTSAGGSVAERGRRGAATLAHGCAGHCAGRSGARSRPPPTERSGATQEGGKTPPAGQRPEGAEGRGDGGEGAGDKAFARGEQPRQSDSGRSAPSGIEGGLISARARDARTRWTSGPLNERRRARRAGARATLQIAPLLWREEWARGDTQRPLIRKAGA